jgi:hypothetical protein
LCYQRRWGLQAYLKAGLTGSLSWYWRLAPLSVWLVQMVAYILSSSHSRIYSQYGSYSCSSKIAKKDDSALKSRSERVKVIVSGSPNVVF